MRKVLLLFVPFCSPVSPPYSLTYIASFLKANSDLDIEIMDLNALAHKRRFRQEYGAMSAALEERDMESYSALIHEFKNSVAEFSKAENERLRHEEQSEVVDWCLAEVMKRKPEVVSLSIVYNSQAFFALVLARKLKELGIPVVIGGPAVTKQLKEVTTYLPHEVALLEFLTGEQQDMRSLDCSRVIDFSSFDASAYMTPELIIPLRTTSTCYYQQCAFCTHHGGIKYVEYDLQSIKESIVSSRARLVFIVDDMIHKGRLLELAQVVKPLNIHWMCQLRPTREFDEATMRTLYDAGLRVVMWGVESGSDRVLGLIKKGTNVADVEEVLRGSKAAGITNVTYVMFGFPTETKDEFIQTIDFLKRNEAYVDLVSTASFGLQEGSPIMDDPAAFGITKVQKNERKMLPEKLTYEVSSGLHSWDARLLQKKYKKTLAKINKFPKEMNIYREHLLYVVARGKD